jgi:paraquat-inducible protein B
MAEPDPPAPAPGELPTPRVVETRRFGLSLVWVVPLVALLIAASLFVRHLLLVGPLIEIEFASAEGIEAGKTDVRYKEVRVGKVEQVALRGDRKRVVVTVRLDRPASGLAVDDTLFWVVRPRVGTAGITGLGTLLSGAYIACDAGVSIVSRSSFVGLEVPPYVLRGEPGSVFVLHAQELGSLEVGSPVLYRRTRVGRVVGYTLDPATDELSLRVFIEAPFQSLVTTQSRFWNASGFNVRVTANGITINTQTLASVIAGGVAFENAGGKATPAPAGASFTLFETRRAAFAPVDGTAVPVEMVFDQSVRGLEDNAPLDFLGVEIGRVRSFALQYDAKRQTFPVRVLAEVYPLRLGAVRSALLTGTPGDETAEAQVVQRMIERGLRAQLRTGNLLTGQLYVGLDFDSKHARLSPAVRDGVVEMPTIPGTLSEIQPQVADIVSRLSRVPFDDIGRNLDATLKGASAAIAQLTPDAQRALAEVQRTLQRAQAALESLDRTMQNVDRNLLDPNASVQRGLGDTLREVERAANALRVLADYLQQHPESLLRGKAPDPALPTGPKR